MAYPLERTWQHAWNTAPASHASAQAMAQSALVFLAALMTGLQAVTDASGAAIGSPGGTWPVLGSSDGSTAALDASARGLNTTIAKWVYATAGSAHSWLALGPGPSGGYLIVDYANASGNNYINLYQSRAAPTGGSTTARPTATDETSALALQLNDGTPSGGNAWTLHGLLSTGGDFWVGVNKNGTGYVQSGILWHYFGSAKGSDLSPWGLYAEFNTSAPGVPSGNGFFNSDWRMRPPDNTGAAGSATTGSPCSPSGAVGAFYSAFPATGDGQDSSIPGWPIPITSYSSSSGSNVTLRGRVVDFRVGGLAGSNVQNNSVEPAAGTPDAVVLGALWFPCNVASVTL